MPRVASRRIDAYIPTFPVDHLAGDESIHALHEFEQIYDLIPQGLATLDRKFRFLRINKTLAEWVDQPSQDVLGQSIFEVLPFLSPTLLPAMHRVLQTGKQVSSVVLPSPSLGVSGLPRKWQITCAPLCNKKGRIEGLILLVQDTAGLLGEDFRSSLAHIQRVSAVGELAASLAHELNQPLTGILSNAQAGLRFLGNDGGQTTEIREVLSDIVADDKRAGEVIGRLRALLKKKDCEFSVIDLCLVVNDVTKILRSDTLLRKASIHMDLAPRLPPVYGDSVQLQQVLLNLVLNGMDAMASTPAEQKIVSIRVWQPDADYLQVSVKDQGCGLSKKQLNEVFEPFYSTKKDGLGIGLAIARSITEYHGGRIWAEPNADRGTTFHLTLPTWVHPPLRE